jgi:hypothetical protein
VNTAGHGLTRVVPALPNHVAEPIAENVAEHEVAALDDGTTAARGDRPARAFDVLCTVYVSHTFENLSAHVELDGNIAIAPGDRVLVHGPAINPPYGETRVERRRATVTRATWLERLWARISGDVQCFSLLDVSFSDRRIL